MMILKCLLLTLYDNSATILAEDSPTVCKSKTLT
jgi:hypothetical protein